MATLGANYLNLMDLVQREKPDEDLQRRLDALPDVARTVSLQSFVPADQPEKLALILSSIADAVVNTVR